MLRAAAFWDSLGCFIAVLFELRVLGGKRGDHTRMQDICIRGEQAEGGIPL